MNIKKLLTESMTSIAYHFCPIDALWAIMESKNFRLTQSDVTSSEDREKCTIGGYTYPYYMCFSRSHSCLSGYVRRRLEGDTFWRKGIVRITVDGNKFNYNFKTVPVNVYSNLNDKRVKNKFDKTKESKKGIWLTSDYLKEKKEAIANGEKNFPSFKVWREMKENEALNNSVGVYSFDKGAKNTGKLNREMTASLDTSSQFHQMLEFEDRLLSNKEEIPAFPYIKRIDILITENGMADKDLIQMVGDILLRNNSYSYKHERSNAYRSYSLPIHVYDNISSFESNDVYDNLGNVDLNKNGGEINPINIINYAKRFGNVNQNFLKQNANLVSKKYKAKLNDSQLGVIATLLSALISIDCRGKREFKNLAKTLIRKYGFNDGRLNGENYESIIMRKLYYFKLNDIDQLRAHGVWYNYRNALRGFNGGLRKYANSMYQLFTDYMTEANWNPKYRTFGQFQTALRNRYEEYTGYKLPLPKSNGDENMVANESFINLHRIINETIDSFLDYIQT